MVVVGCLDQLDWLADAAKTSPPPPGMCATGPQSADSPRAAGIERDDSAEAKLDKPQSLLAPSGGNLPRDMPLLAARLSISGGRYPLPEMTPQRRKAQALTALLDHIRGVATCQPILVLLEDLHWIDPTTNGSR